MPPGPDRPAGLVFAHDISFFIGVQVGTSNSINAFTAKLSRLDNALRRVQDSTPPLATGQRINRAADDPSGLISSENLRAVLSFLEAEADTLRRADAVANTADGALATASDLLNDNAGLELRLANTAGLAAGEAQALRSQIAANEQALTRTTDTAAFAGVPLFDGDFSLQVGGGRLELPDLVTSAPTQQALATLRGEIGAFQRNIVGSRLQVVEATILSTAQTQSIIRDTDFARQTAELLRNQTLSQTATAASAISRENVGLLLDVLA